MKRILLILLLFALSPAVSRLYAQARVAYVDTEYILDKLTDYKSAQKQLDDLSEGWKTEIQKQVDEINKQYKQYQAEWVLLPEDARKKREDDISKKEKELNE